MAVAVRQVDLSQAPGDLVGLEAYQAAHVLIRYHGTPLCQIRLPVREGRIGGNDLWAAAGSASGSALAREVLSAIVLPEAGCDSVRSPLRLPSCTILICTRDRPDDLRRCLDSIVPQLEADTEAIVVDNCPSDDSTRQLVLKYPVRYYRENRRGQNWARARGAKLAQGEVVLFTDDDVVVEPDWSLELRRAFRDENVAAVTGAVQPLELEHPGQERFEEYGGFYRGFEARAYNLNNLHPLSAGRVGAGANMGIRRALIQSMNLFDVELDGGTAAYSGGDTYAFYRLLRDGYTIVYAPSALAWHRHRRTDAELERMLYGYGVGVFTYFLRCFMRHGETDALSAGLSYFCGHHLRLLWAAIRRRPGARPLRLAWAEVKGVLQAPFAYLETARVERRIGPLP